MSTPHLLALQALLSASGWIYALLADLDAALNPQSRQIQPCRIRIESRADYRNTAAPRSNRF